jgi:hypothetical protein
MKKSGAMFELLTSGPVDIRARRHARYHAKPEVPPIFTATEMIAAPLPFEQS